MAATMDFQFPQPAGRDSNISYTPSQHYSPRKQSTSSTIGSLQGPSRTSGQYSVAQSLGPWRLHHTPSIPEIPLSNGCQGAAVRVGSDHAKLHKRRTSKSSIHSRQSQPHTENAYIRPDEAALAENPNTLSSKKISRETLIQNLRRISTYKGLESKSDVIDLSLTIAENQEKSGLRLYSSFTDIRSQADNILDSAGRRRGHARSTSQTSQSSYIASPFQPTAPFVLPMRSTSFQNNQPVANNYASSYTNITQQLVTEGGSRLRSGLSNDAPSPIIASPMPCAMPMRMDLPSTPSLEGGSQSSTPGFPSTRPRGGTDRSFDTMTPIVRTSTDKTFNFKRNKDEPMDYMTRAASIQAARQAFQEKEEAKARKYEKQEQKAMERQQRKESKGGERQPKVVERGMTSNSFHTEKAESMYSAGRTASPERTKKSDRPTTYAAAEESTVSRKKAARSRYRRFITWLKTRLFYLGRGGKSDS